MKAAASDTMCEEQLRQLFVGLVGGGRSDRLTCEIIEMCERHQPLRARGRDADHRALLLLLGASVHETPGEVLTLALQKLADVIGLGLWRSILACPESSCAIAAVADHHDV